MEKGAASADAKRKHSLEDRISQLSDDILICILSFLTVKEAASTSSISKRWKYLWRHTTRLHFDAPSILDKLSTVDETSCRGERSKFVKWVNQVLKLHRGSQLEEFRVSFDIKKTHQRSINKWIKYACERGVQRLELEFLDREYYNRYFGLSCTFPDPLALSTQRLLPEPYSNYCGFQSLKELCLKSVNVSRQVLEYFLQHCPLLERLVVHGSGNMENLEVTGPSLKLTYLEMCDCSNLGSIKVSDVNLVSVVIKNAGKLHLHNVPMLVDVFVSHPFAVPIEHFVKDCFSSISCCLSQLEVLALQIGNYDIKKMELQVFPELTNLKQLVVLTDVSELTRLIGITSLMKSCPLLQKFVMKVGGRLTRSYYNQMRRINEKEICKKTTKEPLQHLKVVELIGYSSSNAELELLLYILKNTVALDKIVINASSRLAYLYPLMGDDRLETVRLRANAAVPMLAKAGLSSRAAVTDDELAAARFRAREQLLALSQYVELVIL